MDKEKYKEMRARADLARALMEPVKDALATITEDKGEAMGLFRKLLSTGRVMEFQVQSITGGKTVPQQLLSCPSALRDQVRANKMKPETATDKTKDRAHAEARYRGQVVANRFWKRSWTVRVERRKIIEEWAREGETHSHHLHVPISFQLTVDKLPISPIVHSAGKRMIVVTYDPFDTKRLREENAYAGRVILFTPTRDGSTYHEGYIFGYRNTDVYGIGDSLRKAESHCQRTAIREMRVDLD